MEVRTRISRVQDFAVDTSLVPGLFFIDLSTEVSLTLAERAGQSRRQLLPATGVLDSLRRGGMRMDEEAAD